MTICAPCDVDLHTECKKPCACTHNPKENR